MDDLGSEALNDQADKVWARKDLLDQADLAPRVDLEVGDKVLLKFNTFASDSRPSSSLRSNRETHWALNRG